MPQAQYYQNYKLLLAFLLLFECFPCTSVGVWLRSSSAAALTGAEGGNTPSGEERTGELPTPWGAAALLVQDVAKLELLVGRTPCLGHLRGRMWHLLMKKQKNHLHSVIPFVSPEPPLCAGPTGAHVAKLQLLKLVLHLSCSWAVPHENYLVFLEARLWGGRKSKASETQFPDCAGTQTFARWAEENTWRIILPSCQLISPRVPPFWAF